MRCEKISIPEFIEKYFNIKLYNYQKEIINMQFAKQCPMCKSYMTPYIKAIYGDYKLVYSCSCGYSDEGEQCIAVANTVIDENVELQYMDHT